MCFLIVSPTAPPCIVAGYPGCPQVARQAARRVACRLCHRLARLLAPSWKATGVGHFAGGHVVGRRLRCVLVALLGYRLVRWGRRNHRRCCRCRPGVGEALLFLATLRAMAFLAVPPQMTCRCRSCLKALSHQASGQAFQADLVG